MLTEATRLRAERLLAELRQRGDDQPAEVIEAVLREAQDAQTQHLDLLTSTQAGELIGVTGQTIKNWVREGRLEAYRIGGRVMIPREAVATYVARARTSLDLEEVPDEEAARLVAEGRQRS